MMRKGMLVLLSMPALWLGACAGEAPSAGDEDYPIVLREGESFQPEPYEGMPPPHACAADYCLENEGPGP